MPKPDALLQDIAAVVEREQSNKMSVTVVVPGAVITGRLAPGHVWTARVAEVLRGSDELQAFAALFDKPEADAGPEVRPTHLHMHMARILQGSLGLPDTGGMFRIAIEAVSSWTIGEFSYSAD